MADDKKPDDKKPPRHRVLYVQRHPGADWQPLASREANDPDAMEDFAAIRIEEINNARRAAAVRPKFRIVIECEGKEVSEVKNGAAA